MHSGCGQVANILRTGARITRAWLSTYCSGVVVPTDSTRGQAWVIRRIIPTFTQRLSPPKFAYLPLAEHYLYPVSTAPTNNHNQMKFKER
jgi:hypothetical protein